MTPRTKTILTVLLTALAIGGVVVGTLMESTIKPITPHIRPEYTVTDLGALSSIANDLNDHGMIVGSSEIKGGSSRGFVYQAGTMTPIATFSGAISQGSISSRRLLEKQRGKSPKRISLIVSNDFWQNA